MDESKKKLSLLNVRPTPRAIVEESQLKFLHHIIGIFCTLLRKRKLCNSYKEQLDRITSIFLTRHFEETELLEVREKFLLLFAANRKKEIGDILDTLLLMENRQFNPITKLSEDKDVEILFPDLYKDKDALLFYRRVFNMDRSVQRERLRNALKANIDDDTTNKLLILMNGAKDQVFVSQFVEILSICGPFNKFISKTTDLLCHCTVSYFIEQSWSSVDCEELLTSLDFSSWFLRVGRSEPAIIIVHYEKADDQYIILQEKITCISCGYAYKGKEYETLPILLEQCNFKPEKEVTLEYITWWSTLSMCLPVECSKKDLFKYFQGNCIIEHVKESLFDFHLAYKSDKLKKIVSIQLQRNSEGKFEISCDNFNIPNTISFYSLKEAVDNINTYLPTKLQFVTLDIDSNDETVIKLQDSFIKQLAENTNRQTPYRHRENKSEPINWRVNPVAEEMPKKSSARKSNFRVPFSPRKEGVSSFPDQIGGGRLSRIVSPRSLKSNLSSVSQGVTESKNETTESLDDTSLMREILQGIQRLEKDQKSILKIVEETRLKVIKLEEEVASMKEKGTQTPKVPLVIPSFKKKLDQLKGEDDDT